MPLNTKPSVFNFARTWDQFDLISILAPRRAALPAPCLAGYMICARIGEGRERAKAQGMRMGRKPKLTDHQKCAAIKRCDHGDETLAEIGRSYNVSGWTISRLA